MSRFLFDGHGREQLPPLGDVPKAQSDDLRRLVRLDPSTVKLDVSPTRSKDAGDGHQGGGLPCAVVADHGDDLALLDAQADAMERLEVP